MWATPRGRAPWRAVLAIAAAGLAPGAARAQDGAEALPPPPAEEALPPPPAEEALPPPPAEEAAPAADAAEALDAPPAPVPGRAVVTHEPGALLPEDWRPRAPPPAPPRPPPEVPAGLPGDFVARPLVLPRGTLQVGFDVTAIVLDADPLATYLPNLALGAARGLELGVAVPTRFDEGERDWTLLDPMPYAAVRFLEREKVEVGARVDVLVPASSEASPHASLLVPVRARPNALLRVDTGLGLELAFDGDVEPTVRVPLGLALQAADWLFAGALATAEIALGGGRRSNVDGELYVGVTVQGRDVAYFDLIARFFLVNVAQGDEFDRSDGGGFALAVRFYPRAF